MQESEILSTVPRPRTRVDSGGRRVPLASGRPIHQAEEPARVRPAAHRHRHRCVSRGVPPTSAFAGRDGCLRGSGPVPTSTVVGRRPVRHPVRHLRDTPPSSPGNRGGVRIPLRPFRSRARPPSVGALSRFMGEERPGSAGPGAAFAAQGLRARCAGDESHDKRYLRLSRDLRDLSLKLGWTSMSKLSSSARAALVNARRVRRRPWPNPSRRARRFRCRRTFRCSRAACRRSA